jgi:hypothetical protein
MRHSVRARLLQTLVWVGCLLALPATALAAGGSPLHIDPASPVAKEYALPLATARGAPPESGKSGKLFGSGIKHADTTTATTTVSAASPPVSDPEPTVTSTATATTTAAVTTPAPVHHRPAHVTTVTLPVLTTPAAHPHSRPITGHATPAAYRVLSPGPGSGLLWMLIVAAVVIGLGSAGGLALRRRR